MCWLFQVLFSDLFQCYVDPFVSQTIIYERRNQIIQNSISFIFLLLFSSLHDFYRLANDSVAWFSIYPRFVSFLASAVVLIARWCRNDGVLTGTTCKFSSNNSRLPSAMIPSSIAVFKSLSSGSGSVQFVIGSSFFEIFYIKFINFFLYYFMANSSILPLIEPSNVCINVKNSFGFINLAGRLFVDSFVEPSSSLSRVTITAIVIISANRNTALFHSKLIEMKRREKKPLVYKN